MFPSKNKYRKHRELDEPGFEDDVATSDVDQSREVHMDSFLADNKRNNNENRKCETDSEIMLTGFIEVHLGVLFCKAWAQMTYILSKDDLIWYRAGGDYQKRVKLFDIVSLDIKPGNQPIIRLGVSDGSGVFSIRMQDIQQVQEFVNAIRNRKRNL